MVSKYNPECLIFDFAGVIIEEPHIVRSVLHPLLLSFNEPITYERVKQAYLKLSHGHISEHQFWKMLEIKDYEKIRAQFIETLKGYYDETFESIKDLLRYRKTIVGSDAPKNFVKEVIKETNYSFDAIITADDIRIPKTNPKFFGSILKRFGIDGKNCMVIDDSMEKLAAAKENGIITVLMVREMISFNKATAEHQPDILVPNLETLSEIIEPRKEEMIEERI